MVAGADSFIRQGRDDYAEPAGDAGQVVLHPAVREPFCCREGAAGVAAC